MNNPSPIEFAARLHEILVDAGTPAGLRGTKAGMARKFKVAQPTVLGWLAGEFMPEPAKVREMAREYKVSNEWLYFGRGPKHVKDANPSKYVMVESDGTVGLPIRFIDAKGSCGGGTGIFDIQERPALIKEPSWFVRYQIDPADALAVWADGDSMSEYIVDGDIAIFNTSKTTPKSGVIFLIEHPEGLRIKVLRRHISGDWILESKSADKRRYPDERIPKDLLDEYLKIKGEFVYRQGG